MRAKPTPAKNEFRERLEELINQQPERDRPGST